MAVGDGLVRQELPPKVAQLLAAGDVLTVVTPGGGGWGNAAAE
jgi:N-methylhydantoinase B/oxoprolinase/acetone carboxylase alpha subunit